MKITKSILCFWAGCSTFACFAAYGLAYGQGAKKIISLENVDASAGHIFVLNYCEMEALIVALAGGALAVTGLLVSCLRNKQPFFSLPHATALIFMVPLVFTVMFALRFR